MFELLTDMLSTAQDVAQAGGNCQLDQAGGNCQSDQAGGKRRKAAKKVGKAPKLSMREKLNNMTVDKLKAKASKMGIRVNKRKDGKLVPIKKATLVEKILKQM